MKKILIALAIALAGATATHAYAATPAETDKLCGAVESYSATVMEGRQVGVPMSSMMAKMDETAASNPVVLKLLRSIIELAFMEPAFQTDENKSRQKREFAAARASACYAAMSSK